MRNSAVINKTNIVLLWIALLSNFGYMKAQSIFDQAENLMYEMAYEQAIPKFISVVKKDSTNWQAGLNLAECYRLTSNSKEAAKWYGKYIKNGKGTSIQKLYYAQALMSSGKYADARKWLDMFRAENPEDKRAEYLILSLDNIKTYLEDSQRYSVEKINCNSSGSDFGAIRHKDGILFISSRDRNQAISRTHGWTGEKFFAIFESKGSGTDFSKPQLFEKSIQTIYNDGPLCFNAAGDEMYLTSNNLENGKTKKSVEGYVKLKLYRYKIFENEWVYVDAFSLNNDNYNVAHASISENGQRLFFASDMPGGKGGMDIYVCQKTTAGWGPPENLGDEINTPGNEVFPFIRNDGTLFFSSNGLMGIGGLDIFSCKEKKGSWLKPKNLMAPINSKDDDFSISFNKGNNEGYLSSNRPSSIFLASHDDNIYYFNSLTPEMLTYTINLKDSLTDGELYDSEITVTDADQKTIFQKSPNGAFSIDLIPNKTYKISTNVYAYMNRQIEWTADKKEPIKNIKLQRSLGIDLEISLKDNLLSGKPNTGITVSIEKLNSSRLEEFNATANSKVNSNILPEATYFTYATKGSTKSNNYFINTVGVDEGSKIYQNIYLDNNIDLSFNREFCVITGQMTDKLNKEPLKGVSIALYDKEKKIKTEEALTDNNGKFNLYSIGLDHAYKITASKDGYYTESIDYTIFNEKKCRTYFCNFSLEKIILNKSK